MSSFTALMALSASKTQEQNNLAQLAIQERQKKEQLQRKQQAEREAKERELEKKLRLKHFEDEKREQERRKRMEATQQAREAALQRKKDEQRDALLYGPKKASSAKASSSSSGGGTAPRERRRLPDDDDDDSSSGVVLTREELRERKQQAEMRRLYSSTKRSATTHSYSKPGRRLPGGAVDITTTQQNPEAHAGRSVKDRLAAMPNTLTKLNTVKRDTRTIDEIQMDLQKKKEGKILDGDEAKSFDDWFSAKKKDPVKKVQTGSAVNSGANTPTSSECAPTSSFPSSSAPAKRPATSSSSKSSAMKTPIPKSSSQPTASRPANGSRADRHAPRPATAASMHTKKRPRSGSCSESPPPKRRAASMEEEDLPGDISSTIWSLFGRKRDKYVGIDVFSDDEDMEADARALEREESFSARVAKREDLEALEDERRHEEEKRRRKKEKERYSRQ
ncbi:hypothetical protein P691DRAFT_675459 [Macrolepiota fuliginosa MF-IS2]|uniref:SPT2 chromatin protein n=1 Tax=Macrolepiota fuliginosa MF-IS2 TaxID=1400762 RepID=A0A9P6BYU9_9AGAR|nr:hypothetical protein P691DRAFT_675459 [Macrolepiota fuliginosa MF-IS2]